MLTAVRRNRGMGGLLPENIIQVTATRTSVTATAAMPVSSDVVVTLRLETNYKVCDVTIHAGNITGTASVQTSSIVRHCLITMAPAKDSKWRYVLLSDTVDIPLMPRNVLTSTIHDDNLTVTAAHPVRSDVTVVYSVLGQSQYTELCRVTIPAGQSSGSATFTPSSVARQVSVTISPTLDEYYEYSPDVNVKQVPAYEMTIYNIATATTITSTTNRWGVGPAVRSDVTITIRLRGSSEVFATVVIPAGQYSSTVNIEPSPRTRECEIGWSPGYDAYMQYTMSYFMTIPAQN